jgi:ribose 1,5-bisphosphokinase PhnN
MALNYPKDNRIFEDLENINKRIYRESECHAKIDTDTEHIRNDRGFEKKIFEQIYDPNDQ